jgi:hypothetical protein
VNDELETKDEFYIDSSFTGNFEFSINYKIMYHKFEGKLMQLKNTKSEDLAMSWNINEIPLDFDTVDDIYPLNSNDHLYWYGKSKSHLYQVYLLPFYNMPKLALNNLVDSTSIECEYFYHKNNNYVIHMLGTYYNQDKMFRILK